MARYIDADALLIELQEELEFKTPMYTEEQNGCFNLGVKCAIRDVKRQPTSDVAEVKHGEWIHSNRGFNIQGDYECSNCHSPSGIKHFYNGDKYTYCPDCGAKMDGGNDHGKEKQTSEDI